MSEISKTYCKRIINAKRCSLLPWKTLDVDLFHLNGKNYLVVIDYFSKFVEIRQLKEIISTNTVNYYNLCLQDMVFQNIYILQWFSIR